MATDFFARQDDAHRRTGRLLLYFVLAIVLIILTLYAATTGLFFLARDKKTPFPPIWDPIRFAVVAGVTTLVIAIGSLFKMFGLREGGPAVARMLGGRLLDGSTTDLTERRLLNVVEEMAIASGVPVPPVYVLDEEKGINAFAAGYSPSDAVIGITRGTLDHLDRDQLQGVVAHEFSHILNGDMRIDVRLMGVVFGILMIALVGEAIMKFVFGAPRGRSRSSSSDKKDNSAILLFLIGLGLFLIGYIGMFFARLIKCAVSRQREFLADASAVQFTRNPEGISGALKKIGGLSKGSMIVSSNAEQACHLFFGEGVLALTDLMATHPPLADRIRRIDPNFDGAYPDVDHETTQRDETAAKPADKPRSPFGAMEKILPGIAKDGTIPVSTAAVLASVGTVNPEHVEYATNLIAVMPDSITSAAREPFGAAALIYALLLDDDVEIRSKQIEYLAGQGAKGIAAETARLVASLGDLGAEARVPIVDLSLPALRRLSANQYDQFRAGVETLIRADGRISLFEFALQRMMLRHLDRQFRKIPPNAVRYSSLGPLLGASAVLVSSLARIGQSGAPAIDRAFGLGIARLGEEGKGLSLAEPKACSLSAVDAALAEIATASAPVKKRILDACTACITADGKVTVSEGELLRAVADSFDCPMPPLLPSA